jgi:chromosome segregation ATPase
MSEQLYRFYDGGGRLLYIGVSIFAIKRMREHAKDKPWWDEVRHIEIEQIDADRPEMLRIERHCIETEKPLYNKAHNDVNSLSYGYVSPVRTITYSKPQDLESDSQVSYLRTELDRLNQQIVNAGSRANRLRDRLVEARRRIEDLEDEIVILQRPLRTSNASTLRSCQCIYDSQEEKIRQAMSHSLTQWGCMHGSDA